MVWDGFEMDWVGIEMDWDELRCAEMDIERVLYWLYQNWDEMDLRWYFWFHLFCSLSDIDITHVQLIKNNRFPHPISVCNNYNIGQYEHWDCVICSILCYVMDSLLCQAMYVCDVFEVGVCVDYVLCDQIGLWPHCALMRSELIVVGSSGPRAWWLQSFSVFKQVFY